MACIYQISDKLVDLVRLIEVICQSFSNSNYTYSVTCNHLMDCSALDNYVISTSSNTIFVAVTQLSLLGMDVKVEQRVNIFCEYP